MDKNQFTIDHIITKDIRICQPKSGFRFTTDSLLLAGFVQNKPYHNVIEIGAGSGIISVLLAHFYKVKKIFAIEIDDTMFEALCHTISINKLEEKIIPVKVDIKDFKPNEVIDMIVSNPPYRKSETGYTCKNRSKNSARFSEHLEVKDIFNFSKSYLKTKGHLYISYIADRTSELFEAGKYGLEPKRLRYLHPDLNKKARLIFMEYRKGSGIEMTIEPPIFHYINKAQNEEFLNFTNLYWWKNKK